MKSLCMFSTLVACLFLFHFTGYVNGIDEKLTTAMQFKNEFRDKEALNKFEEIINLRKYHYVALWNAAMLHTSIGYRQSESDAEEKHYEQAFFYAKRLLDIYPDSAGTHFAYAAALGRKAQSAGARERIQLSTQIREHAETAVELDPEYARAWNVLGVWHHRAANLSRLERFAANALFGGAPEGASNEKAIRSFNKAIKINPDFILFYHDQAEFYLTIGKTDNARQSIRKGLSLKETTSDDKQWKENMRHMLEKL